MLTLTMYDESWILRSRGPVVGATVLPQTWETVNIVIAPEAVRIIRWDQKTDSPWFEEGASVRNGGDAPVEPIAAITDG